MSFLAPGFLIAAAAAALVVVGLHFLSTREPRLEVLPTARFLPDLPLHATATAVRPTDFWLMLLRVALLLLIGAALARPVLEPEREPIARIVALDVSRAVGDAAELADSARTYTARAAAVVLFDSSAREVRQAPGDSLTGSTTRGSLSAALIVAQRAAARVRNAADSVELVIVSPFVGEERDAATESIRALWPGRITTVRVTAAVPSARGDSIRVEWADSGATARWSARSTPDTVAGIRAGDVVLVHPFIRRWRAAEAGSTAGRVIARWADGEPAAFEYAGAPGCARSYGFALPSEGDALLRPAFQRFIESMDAPCGEPPDFTPLPASVMESLQGAGPLAPAAAIERRVERVTPLAPWLLIAALLLALLELFTRRRRAEQRSVEEEPMAKAA